MGRDDLFQDQTTYLFVCLGGLTPISKALRYADGKKGKDPLLGKVPFWSLCTVL